jgi:tetratricopeptide (TPR) repeat protein/O-antigen ligase
VRTTDPKQTLFELEDYLVLTAVLLLPWAFGGVEIWAYRTAAFLLVASGAWASWKRGLRGWGLDRRQRWLAPAGLLGLWAAFQLVPLPPRAVQMLSPTAHGFYEEAYPGYPDAATKDPLSAIEEAALRAVPEAAGRPLPADPETLPISVPACLGDRWRPLSMQPSATEERWFWYLALLVGFLVVRERVGDRRRFRAYRWALFALFGALALFALVQAQTWNGKIYWLRPVLIAAQPFGPYYNPTHLAGVMELALPALAGYVGLRLQRAGIAARYESRVGVAVVLFGVCAVALVAASSKLAVAAAGLSLAVLVLTVLPGARLKVGGAVALAGVLAASGWLLAESRVATRVSSFFGRVEGSNYFGERLGFWRAAGGVVEAFPVTGSGFGSFPGVVGRYIARGASFRPGPAHNDYLELLAEGGAVAFGLTVWLGVAYGRRALRRLGRRGSGVSVSRLGLLLGLLSLAVHAAFDFNHQVPANALLFVTLAAMVIPLRPEEARTRPSRWRPVAVCLAAAVIAVFGYRAASGAVAGWNLIEGQYTQLDGQYEVAAPLLERAAVGSNRLRGLTMAAETRIDLWDRQVRTRGALVADRTVLYRAAECFLACRCVAPASRQAWEGLGEVYDGLEWSGREQRSLTGLQPVADPWDRVGRPGRVAIGLMREGVERAPTWYRIHDKLALTLWGYGIADGAREAVRTSALALPAFDRHWYAAVTDLPEWIRIEFASASWDAIGKVSFMTRADQLIALGKLEAELGNSARAIEAFSAALEQAGGADDVNVAEARFNLALAFRTQGREAEARRELELAVAHPIFRFPAMLQLAIADEQAGDLAAALEKLRRLRWEDPDNVEHCLRFARLARQMGNVDAALESLRWASLRHGSDLRVEEALAEIHIERGELEPVLEALARLQRNPEAAEVVARLEQALRTAAAGRQGS